MGKQRVRFARDGSHAYTPEKTVSFEGRLAYAAQIAMGDRLLYENALVVDIVIVVPIPASKPEKWKAQARSGALRPTKKPDFDNYSKMVDALNLIVWTDDAIIIRGVVDKFYGDRPMYALRIREADERDRPIPQWALDALKGTPNAETEEGIFA